MTPCIYYMHKNRLETYRIKDTWNLHTPPSQQLEYLQD